MTKLCFRERWHRGWLLLIENVRYAIARLLRAGEQIIADCRKPVSPTTLFPYEENVDDLKRQPFEFLEILTWLWWYDFVISDET